MDAEDPSRAVAMSPRNSWIFVKRDTIEEQLAGHPFASRPSPVDVHLSSPPSPDEVHLSPYLRTMLQVIREMRIDPDNQSTKKKVVAALRTAWSKRFSHLGTLSENLCDHMATLVREPESQRGRGAKKKNLSKPIKD
jgi:hypothetical protein